MSVQIGQPYATMHDKYGRILDNGLVYIGTVGQNAELYPIQVFYDEDLTIPAPQPLRTINGFFSRNGSPAKIFIKNSECSIIVKDKFRILQWLDLNYAGILTGKGVSASDVIDESGRTQQEINNIINMYVNPRMFGAKGDGIANDTQPIRDCFDYMLANDAIFYDYSGNTYRFNTDILVTAPNKSITIETNVKFISNTSLLKITGTIEDLGSLTVPAQAGSISITGSFLVQSGQVVALHNTTLRSFARHRAYYTNGEFKIVDSVNAGVIKFTQPLETSYTGTAVDKFYRINPVKLTVNGLTVESSGPGVFNLSLSYLSSINMFVKNSGNASNSNYAMQFDRVLDSAITGGDYIKEGISGTGTDYGLVFANCQDIKNTARYCFGGRHGVSTGGSAVPASVPNRRVNTIGVKIENDPTSFLHAADFHGNTADSYYQDCLIFGRISLSGYNTSSRRNTIYSRADDVRVPIGFGEVVGGCIESIGDTIMSSGGASGIAGWLSSSEVPLVSSPSTFRIQDIKFFGNSSLVGILAISNMPLPTNGIIDGFELLGTSTTMTRLVTYNAGTEVFKPSYIQITRPAYAVPEDVLLIAGAATLTTTIKNVFATSGSNANGSWIKNSDGSMICRQKLTRTLPISTAITGGFKSVDIAWPFPKTFVLEPSLIATSFDNSSFSIKGTSTSSSTAQLYAINPTSITSTEISFDVVAIGRYLY